MNKRIRHDCRIDIDPIVRLRDALAHGRAFGFGTIANLRLLKFDRKRDANGKIPVALAEDMTNEWFIKNIIMLQKALEKIRKALDYEQREFV